MNDEPQSTEVETPAEASPGWVFQVLQGQARLGEVLERNPDFLRVRFGEETYTWQSIPSSARLIDETTIEFAALTDPDGLRNRFASEPGVVVRELLQGREQPLSGAQVQQSLVTLRLLAPEDLNASWKKLQPKLKKDPHIEASGRPATYSFVAQPVTATSSDLTASEALEALSKARVPKERREELLTRISQLEASGELSIEERAWRSLLLDEEASLDWDGLDPGNLTASGKMTLLEHALKQGEESFVVRLALEAKDSEATRRASTLLERTLAPESIAPVIENELDRWNQHLENVQDNDELGTALAGDLRRTPGVRKAFERTATPRLISQLLKILAASRTRSGRAECEQLAGWCIRLLENLRISRVDLRASIADLDLPAQSKLAAALAGEPIASGSLRRSLLRGLAETSREILTQKRPWEDLKASDILDLMDDPLLKPLLTEEPVLSSVVLPRVTSAMERDDLRSLLLILAAPQPVVHLLPAERLAVAIGRAVKSDHAQRVLASFPSQSNNLKSLEEKVKLATEELSLLRKTLDEERRRSEELEERLRLAVGEQRALSAEDTRRAKLKAMRVLADALEDLRRVKETSEMSSAISNALTKASAEGLRIDEDSGELSNFDPSKHNPMGLELEEGQPVRLIDASYIVEDPNGQTVVRKGGVQPSK